MVVALLSTRPRREARLAQDFCDCGFHRDVEIICEAVAPGLFYIKASREALETCLSMAYFSRQIGRVEYYDYVTREEPACEGCEVRRVGGLFFVRVK